MLYRVVNMPYTSGRQQTARGPKLASQQKCLARACRQIILKADGSEINLS